MHAMYVPKTNLRLKFYIKLYSRYFKVLHMMFLGTEDTLLIKGSGFVSIIVHGAAATLTIHHAIYCAVTHNPHKTALFQ